MKIKRGKEGNFSGKIQQNPAAFFVTLKPPVTVRQNPACRIWDSNPAESGPAAKTLKDSPLFCDLGRQVCPLQNESVWVRQCPSESANVRPSLPMSVQVRHCPSKSAIVRPSPLMSVQVRQCPSMSANVRPSPPMSVYVRQCPKNHVRCLIESKKDRT